MAPRRLLVGLFAVTSTACTLLLDATRSDHGDEPDGDVDASGQDSGQGDGRPRDGDHDGDQSRVDGDASSPSDADQARVDGDASGDGSLVDGDSDRDGAECTVASDCEEPDSPCWGAACLADGTCSSELLDDGSECGNSMVCQNGVCVSCEAGPDCHRPLGCPVEAICDLAELVFEDPEPVVGIGPREHSCGVTRRGETYYALCSRADSGFESSRHRPYGFWSSDGVEWSESGLAVANPEGYWWRTEFEDRFQDYFQHQSDYPITLADSTFYVVARTYFAWTGPDWAPFVASWASADFMGWEGYMGRPGDEGRIVTWGNDVCPSCGATAPSVYELADESLVAYSQVTWPVSWTGSRYRTVHRFTSSDRERWTRDESFELHVDETFSDVRSVDRVFILGEELYALNFTSCEAGGGSGCEVVARWFWAISTSGLEGSFDGLEAVRPWWIDRDCDAPIDASDLSEPFFLRDHDRVRVYYRLRHEEDAHRWETALSRFVVEPCGD